MAAISTHSKRWSVAILRTLGSGLQTLRRRYSLSWKTLGLIAPMRISRDSACFASVSQSSTRSQGM